MPAEIRLAVQIPACDRRDKNRLCTGIFREIDIIRRKNIIVGISPRAVLAGAVERVPVETWISAETGIGFLIGFFVIMPELNEQKIALADRGFQRMIILLSEKAADS